jgi:NAD+ synthase (glutamine-hydrolysing)
MAPLRIALAQINTIVGDVEGNAARARRMFDRARDSGADLLVLPEQTLPGYPAEDLLFRPAFIRANRTALERLVPESRGIAALVGFVDSSGDDSRARRNAAAVLNDGALAGVYHKHRLPNYGVFDEARYFRPGDRPMVFVCRGVRVALTICEDIWVDDGPGEAACREGGARVLVNLSASPYHIGKPREREELFSRRARILGTHILICNLVGGQDELVFDGSSVHIDPEGRTRARGKLFEEDFLIVEVEAPEADLGDAAGARSRGTDVVVVELSDPAHVPLGSSPRPNGRAPSIAKADAGRREPEPPLPSFPAQNEEIYRALCLGTRDYCRKNGFERVLIGLSGGVDSALAATIAADALGAGAVVGVAMPSRFSSKESVEDGRALAANLGVEFREISIAKTYDAVMQALEPSFRGTPFAVAEENLQARIRGNILMALSNKFGWLVLTTGNKSEVAVGYCTLYGDTAGGFAILKDIYKTTVYELCRHRNRLGPVIPERIIAKPPSAELRPGQKDTDSLPPYDVLDPILKAYVEDDRGVREIVELGFDRALVTRVTGLVDRSEYKRRQSPPGVKITRRAFGKDRRLPITSAFVVEPRQ